MPAHATSGGFGQPGGPLQCTAKSKRSGIQCKGPAVKDSPSQKCRMHGGRSHTIGTANSQFKNGRHSKYLPAQLDSLYREALANPDLLEMADHIALLEAKIQETMMEQTEEGLAPRWSEVASTFADLEMAVLSGDMEKIGPALELIHQMMDNGSRWDRTMDTVQGYMEQLRKMTDTEIKRKKELNQMVPIERVIILMAAVADSVKRNVTNRGEIEAVYRDLSALHHSGDALDKGVERVGPQVIDVTPTKRDRSVKAAKAIDVQVS